MALGRSKRIRGSGWYGVLLAVGLCAGGAHAAREAGGSSVVVPQAAVHQGDLYAADRTVVIRARVNGDVAAAGESVTISGPVQGYAMAAGADVAVSGPVGNDLWAAGRTVTVSAPVADNAMLAGANVVLQPSASVGHDAQIAGRTVQIRGRIGRNLKLAAGAAQLASEVRGSVEAHTEHLTLEPGALVRGNLVVYSAAPPQISPQARVLGRVEYHAAPAQAHRSGLGEWIGWWLFRFLALLLLGAVCLALAPVWIERVTGTITRRTGDSLLAGLACLILIPMAVVPLMVVLIGIPLALLLIAVYVAALLLSGVCVAYWFGEWLVQRAGKTTASPYARLAVGAAILSVLVGLPWVGWIFGVAVALFGFGGLALDAWDRRQRPHAEGLA